MLETYTAACGCVVSMKLHTASAGDQDIHVVWISKRCDGHGSDPSTVTLTSRPSRDDHVPRPTDTRGESH